MVRSTPPAGAETRADGSGARFPGLPRTYVPRPRLWHRLDQARDATVTVLLGPAGSGKTLGVVGWLRQTGLAERTTWLTATRRTSAAELVAAIDQAAAQRPARLVVVDDAHLLRLAAVRAVDDRLDRDPTSLDLLLLSRWDLPLSRLTPELRGDLRVLRGDVLRLDEDESSRLVAAHAGTTDVRVARAVADRSRGWAAATVLAARSVASSADPRAAADLLAGGSVSVADQVAGEVFSALPAPARHLLLCVASEPAVSAETAAHLTGDPEAGAVLADLEATGLLVHRLGSDPAAPAGRYQIHPLLTEVVRRRVRAGGADVEAAARAVCDAVATDVARGEPTGAVRRLSGLGRADAAAALIGTEGPRLLLRGDAREVVDFVRAHPATVEAEPGCWFTLGVQRWLAGDVAGAATWLDRVVATTASGAVRIATGRLMRARAGLEPAPSAILAAREALATGSEAAGSQAVADLALLQHELGVTLAWCGELRAAADELDAATVLAEVRMLPVLRRAARSELALTAYASGREIVALAHAEAVLADAGEADCPGDTVSTAGETVATARARLVSALVRWGELPLVSPSDAAGLRAACGTFGEPMSAYWAQTLESRLALLEGDLDGAQRTLNDLHPTALLGDVAIGHLVQCGLLAGLAGDGDGLGRIAQELAERDAAGEQALVRALRAELAGDLRGAVQQLRIAQETTAAPQPPVRPIAQVLAAQLLDALGDREAADLLIAAALQETVGRRSIVAFVGWSRRGTDVRELLGRGATAGWAADVATGLTRFRGLHTEVPTAAPTAARQERAVVPELSPREGDVLRELARGATYADIAATLFVSENTVKTHVSNLYAKLSVSRRSDALATARSLHLL
ncbi:hypothetical protein FXB39_04870 [Nocardioides sp. BGMRC 2183]|nr:hypothetical protein FXB39_04870 [Nocardioides sp. BGMRC 2183]